MPYKCGASLFERVIYFQYFYYFQALIHFMKKAFILFLSILFTHKLIAQQRIIAECTISYNISATDSANVKMKDALKASSKTVYIKGNESRVNLVSPAFNQSVIYDKTSGEATILREFGSNKFITKLYNDKWLAENKQFENSRVETTDEHKTILGYDCTKAFIHLKDSSVYTIYYATTIIPSVKEFEYLFKEVNGLVLCYEGLGSKGEKVVYTATKVNLSPVPISAFSIPSSGYRGL